MKAKRSLGQNFFVNSNLADYIVNIVSRTGSNSILEIGPGMGFFTQRLNKVFDNVTVVEKDTNLANSLKIQFPNINVLNEDFLNMDLTFLDKEYMYFGSLPYNVSKPIIRKIIESSNFNNESFFIVQKEVAEKYIYKKPYSTLSLTTTIYAKCKKILDISPDSFRPKPNVNSSLITISPSNTNIQNRELLEKLIHTAFKQPRKNIHNNLKNSQFEKGSLPFQAYRPAQLDLESYIQILNLSL
ncbi:MAG: Ribosomal RNA small subunit methyltransferase A [candidate division WS6 bacterium GW2011_GWE1_34_7]|uniref:Ribosomal RNA small subunit methyltransferase A n=1 Tax=candidate division WS6 bacterium GW2011_GWE1_34_7 TaxID=1619093 RepID=A0A0G0DSJ1_9BACT|nr:MAG: Ribosomal RNA small subunit methyltransferase A [candidate division WS6 bacterium GW2011_GWE1_34_7]